MPGLHPVFLHMQACDYTPTRCQIHRPSGHHWMTAVLTSVHADRPCPQQQRVLQEAPLTIQTVGTLRNDVLL